MSTTRSSVDGVRMTSTQGTNSGGRTSARRGNDSGFSVPPRSFASGWTTCSSRSRVAGSGLDLRVDGELGIGTLDDGFNDEIHAQSSETAIDGAAERCRSAVAVVPPPTFSACSSRGWTSGMGPRRFGQRGRRRRRARSGCRSRRTRANADAHGPDAARRPWTAKRFQCGRATSSRAPRARPRRPPSERRRGAGAGRAHRGRSPRGHLPRSRSHSGASAPRHLSSAARVRRQGHRHRRGAWPRSRTARVQRRR